MKCSTIKMQVAAIALGLTMVFSSLTTPVAAMEIGFNVDGEFGEETGTITGMFTFDTVLQEMTSFMLTTTNPFFLDGSNEPLPSPVHYSLPGSDFNIQLNDVDGLIVDQGLPDFGIASSLSSRLTLLVIDNTLPNATRALVIEEFFLREEGGAISFRQEGFATISRKGINPAPVPEPGTIMLMATGLLGLAGYRWKQGRGEKVHIT